MYRHSEHDLRGPASHPALWPTREEEADLLVDDELSIDSDDEPIRMDLVERVRREIEAGTYETEEKLGLAVSRLLMS